MISDVCRSLCVAGVVVRVVGIMPKVVEERQTNMRRREYSLVKLASENSNSLQQLEQARNTKFTNACAHIQR